MRRILIATDGQPVSQEAIHQFVHSAGIGESELYLLSVVSPPHAGIGREERLMDAVEQADSALANATLEMAVGGRTIRSFSRIGEPAPTIIAAADELGVDLVVLGTRGPEGLRQGHSVAEAVLHGVSCGVLIYPMRAVATVV